MEAFKQIDNDWTVSTFIVNHEDGLRFVHLYAVAKVIPAKKKVAITMVKLTQAALTGADAPTGHKVGSPQDGLKLR